MLRRASNTWRGVCDDPSRKPYRIQYGVREGCKVQTLHLVIASGRCDDPEGPSRSKNFLIHWLLWVLAIGLGSLLAVYCPADERTIPSLSHRVHSPLYVCIRHSEHTGLVLLTKTSRFLSWTLLFFMSITTMTYSEHTSAP